MDKKQQKEEIKRLQRHLLQIQHAYTRDGRKAMIVLEGWDAAGKGGLIRRFAAGLDPRPLKVWRIGPPAETEEGAHWLRRFWVKVPAGGEIAVFDRSWYGRVLVERIEGFASEDEWRRAYDEINHWEQSLCGEGYRLVKLFLDITPEEQLNRFRDRYDNPAKRWKITEDDLRNRARWDDYAAAYEEMIERTSSDFAPWHRLKTDSKHEARVRGLTAIADHLSDGVDLAWPDVSPSIHKFFAQN
ncbi:MAG: AMP phosphotransferase [Alphaproteobacteria bacterium]|nr:AMP phosphotransferase [Alphaproteobacteria bacterium SS10]